DTAQRWAEAVQGREPEAVYPLVLWNCLWRAGSSLPHGHAQVLVAKGRAFAGHESLRRAAEAYTRQHDAAYFDDLYRAHAALGCAFEREGVRVLAYLAPLKEREALILAPALSAALKDALYDVLACYRDRLGVQSFNLVLYQPPLAPTAESWDGFPRVVRVVDRGPLSERTCDIGAMELYGASVVASDPFELAGALAQALDARL
ncbi:MAG: hypothetical protein HYS09_03945, partial [Chloroflexi bacterium]|nr:hypothetical protein [Chloroflexota bacterium]